MLIRHTLMPLIISGRTVPSCEFLVDGFSLAASDEQRRLAINAASGSTAERGD